MRQEDLVGTWRLVSFEVRATDGAIAYPWGHDPAGYLIYGGDGYMGAAIMCANRPHFAAGDIGAGTIEERAEAARTYISYFGRYDVRGDSVIHHVEVSLFPNWIGEDQERFAELTAGRLVLRTPPLPYQGQERSGYLVWARAGGHPVIET